MAQSTPNWLHLSDGEDVVWESRPHPVEMGLGVPAGVALVLAGFLLAGWSATQDGVGALTLVGVAVSLLGLGFALARYVVWTSTRYVITTSELYKKRGVVSRDVTQFRLDRVQNTSLSQDVGGRLLGYGDLTVYTAGSGEPELTFERAPRPEYATGLLNDQLERATRSATEF
ncbi:PH domain-containing protein [Salinilacihabitans rarus]|uniref:PH domain-containing protein n=1 Tax=Salinilacihabitans rarus TaxID=2961596 RepID=UPI0020C868D8|nr:PH domain-containing protein [Salinilacihabitans rarus]